MTQQGLFDPRTKGEARTGQKRAILAYLMAGNRLTHLDALTRFGCARLAARANELKADGYPIVCDMVKRGKKRWGEYRLERESA